MFLAVIPDFTLPLTNPVLKFLIILLIILFVPILLNKLKFPHILGLIIAGAVIGPNGFNLLQRDSGIILSGTAGLLYIMFLAGLDIDITEFKKNSGKSAIFGGYTFIIPMTLGIFSSYYILGFSWITSVLLASMYASHTLIAYPVLSKLDVTKNRAVNITVGGTMITDILALLVLAIIVKMTAGALNMAFWWQLSISILLAGGIILFLFPVIGRWFLKRFEDKVLQYIFVLSMVFLGAFLAEVAGIEAIIGAFLSGLALNQLIPVSSPLMNRIVFVGNAIFIPFFLIGVGMLVDFRVFFNDLDTLKVAAVMTFVATLAKFSAAWLTQKTFGYTADERRLIFGLSNAQAAATLAAVIVGYNVILGETSSGEPIRLLNESVLNGTIIMILITCTIASLAAQKGGKNISLGKINPPDNPEKITSEKILIPVSNPATVEELILLGTLLKSGEKSAEMFALSVITEEGNDLNTDTNAKKLFEKVAEITSATDIHLNHILRYDYNAMNGILGVIKENNISDLVLGLHIKQEISDSFLGKLTNNIILKSNITTFIYKPFQPSSTLKRHIIVVPQNAEKVVGFPFWLKKIKNLGQNSGAKLIFFGAEQTLSVIRNRFEKVNVNAGYKTFNEWENFGLLSKELKPNDNLILILSREHKPSYHAYMAEISEIIKNYFQKNSFMLVYPMQLGVFDQETIDLRNPSFMLQVGKLEKIQQSLSRFLPKKDIGRS